MSLSNTSTNNNRGQSVPSDRLWLRSELMGTQVITTDTGRRLGVVGEVIVDIDRREVVALGLRDNPLTRFLPGLPKWMPLESIKQVGDVILVDSLDSLSDGFSPERYGKVKFMKGSLVIYTLPDCFKEVPGLFQLVNDICNM